MKQYVIFDRDGTLIEHVHHMANLKDLKLVPLLGETLKEISNLGFALGIVTNQSVISRGIAQYDTVIKINNTISSLVRESHGVKFDFISVCPHLPEHGCECRKPKIGLIKTYIEEGKIDVANSFMVGDQPTDVEFGRRAGLKTVYIGGAFVKNGITAPDYCMEKLSDLPNLIRNLEKK